MKKLLLGLLLVIPLLVGCRQKPTAEVVEEALVPTAREREVLRAYNLPVESEKGQKKLRKLRERTEKLAAAKERMESYATEAQERAEEEAAIFED